MQSNHQNDNWINQALDFCVRRVHENIANLDRFPERTKGNQWVLIEPEKHGWWVGGHWVGLIWLAYAATQDPEFEAAARKWSALLLPRQTDSTTHDLGFLFKLSYIWGYQLTQNETLIFPALRAAETLSWRFNPRGGYFQAWGPLNARPELRGRAIVDTMMNLDLLFWASQQTGDPKFAKMALTHARTVLEYQVRPDFTTSHVIDFDPVTGEFLKQDTHQGLSSDSCWSRGQAWAVYGFGDCFRATGETEFLEAARNLASYALKNNPADFVPYWDYDSPEIPNDVRDSSAAAILASSLLNFSVLETDVINAAKWRESAEVILKSLWENYTSHGTNVPSILIHGTRSKPHGMMDHGLIYGDYYFMEALLSLNGQLVW
jgi:unsaturated chondroitin disaccharide hydrolase